MNENKNNNKKKYHEFHFGSNDLQPLPWKQLKRWIILKHISKYVA